MINKLYDHAARAVADIEDGSTILVGGFGSSGSPVELLHALIDQGEKSLTIVSNNTGAGHVGLAALIEQGRVEKMICSFPRTANSTAFQERLSRRQIELELVPQGTLAERIRAGGAGIPAFYTPTGIGTVLSNGKERRSFSDRSYVLEHAIKAEYALIKARTADRYGNLVYNKTARNFAPVMATAAHTTIVQAATYVDIGDLDPETVITPGIFVQRIVKITDPLDESSLVVSGSVYP